MCMCLPLQAVSINTAGIHLQCSSESTTVKSHTAGESLQTTSWPEQGLPERASADLHVQLREDGSNLTLTDFPADMLLYYNLQTLTKVNCGSYFRALGGADFSVLSSVLNRQSALFTNAKDCLGISGVSLNRTQVEVLGNMACTLDPTYIQNSDPLILEKLKNCGDLSVSQITAIQTLLFSGNSSYG
ncbi:mesothelin-like protein [Pygocentrus nattereri]|uniref:mesothelin-like protein n=1 Tax=Pygocentrus nattereri TaxID=42514 RepID=UPI0018911C21|nr:mesothelin-like protein [Pygocentrus nattereri]